MSPLTQGLNYRSACDNKKQNYTLAMRKFNGCENTMNTMAAICCLLTKLLLILPASTGDMSFQATAAEMLL